MIETVKKEVYKAFGLSVLSEIPLPELPQMSMQQDMADIVIERADLSELWCELNVKQGKFVVKENRVIFQISNTATFCIQEGNKIIVSPMQGSDEDKIRLYLLGSCMGALLLQRKVLPLHGSAIAVDGKAYAVIGDSGAGKSTLASALLSRGYPLLSDDVIPITLSQTTSIPFVAPSYPQQKLWQESLENFGMKASQYRPLFERESKYAVPVPANFSTEPLPLAGVFELVKTENQGIVIQRVPKLERLHTLFCHTYRNFLIPRMGLTAWHFDITASIVNKIDFFQLQRPISGFTASHLASLILTTINQGDNND